MQAVFVTGASGFVGRHLLPRLAEAGIREIFCLSRTQPVETAVTVPGVQIRRIRGSLFDTALYAGELAAAECVIHLAAATGKAPPEEHFRINATGTRTLLEQCQKAGPKKFLHVSTIAVKFPDKTNYHYALAKEEAEGFVRTSGLSYTILRPTMIFGAGSAVLAGLERLAALPVTPIFGDGRTRVQPIHVEDVARLITEIVRADRFRGETLEIGGPEILTIEELLACIRRARSGRPLRTVHLPLGLMVAVLKPLEKLFYAQLPFTIGQLATFRNAGTIKRNSLWEEHCAHLKNLNDMLSAPAAHGVN